MGEVQLPLKISTNYYITFATSGHYDLPTGPTNDLYDSSLLLPTGPTKLKLKFPGLPSFSKRRNSGKPNAHRPRNTKTGRWSFFRKASNSASFSHGQDSRHSSPSRVSSFGGDAREKIVAVYDASPVWNDYNDQPLEGKFPGLPSFSKRRNSGKPNAHSPRNTKTGRWSFFRKASNSASFSFSHGQDSRHSSPSRVSCFGSSIRSKGGGNAREKIDAVYDASPVWDDYNDQPPEGLREAALQLEVAPQVDSLKESTDVDEEEEVNGKTTDTRKKEDNGLAFKLLVRMPMTNWERKLQAMSAKGRIVGLSIARMLLWAEEMNIKMRTTTINWNGGEVRVFKGEEPWYMKEVRGLRCRPLKREALYDYQKRYPVPLLDNGDVSDSALDDATDSDEEDGLGVHGGKRVWWE